MPLEHITKLAYTTAATAKGGREGRVRTKDGVVDLPLGKPGSRSNPVANPETLFAAGYAACFSGALNHVAGEAGFDTAEATVTATVDFGSTGIGFGLAVDIAAHLPGVDPDRAAELVQQAHAFCPYSKATRGNIEVTAHVA